jgi:hypothetical protein
MDLALPMLMQNGRASVPFQHWDQAWSWWTTCNTMLQARAPPLSLYWVSTSQSLLGLYFTVSTGSLLHSLY